MERLCNMRCSSKREHANKRGAIEHRASTTTSKCNDVWSTVLVENFCEKKRDQSEPRMCETTHYLSIFFFVKFIVIIAHQQQQQQIECLNITFFIHMCV